ncbi:MAG: hypothetical protein AAGK32_21130, partial [Actinomycetota bacterium]
MDVLIAHRRPRAARMADVSPTISPLGRAASWLRSTDPEPGAGDPVRDRGPDRGRLGRILAATVAVVVVHNVLVARYDLDLA